MNCELPDAQAGFWKGRGTREQIANICWIIEKAREFQKNIYVCFIDYAKPFDFVDHKKLWKILKRHGMTTLPASREICMQEQQYLEPDMEQWTDSILGKEYIKAAYCPSAYVTKGNQSWILIGRTDAEAKTPILWPPDAKNWLIWKDPDAGKDWRQEEKGTTEDEMAGWHHRLNGPEFE